MTDTGHTTKKILENRREDEFSISPKKFRYLDSIYISVAFSALFTLLIVFIVWYYFNEDNKLAAIGQVLGAWGTVLAFCWVFVSQDLQRKDLSVQTFTLQQQLSEIAKQRQDMDKQLLLSSRALSFEFCRNARIYLGQKCMTLISGCLNIQQKSEGVVEKEISRLSKEPELAARYLLVDCEVERFYPKLIENPVYRLAASTFSAAYDEVRKLAIELDPSESAVRFFFEGGPEAEIADILRQHLTRLDPLY